jgi:hypothetical protein
MYSTSIIVGSGFVTVTGSPFRKNEMERPSTVPAAACTKCGSDTHHDPKTDDVPLLLNASIHNLKVPLSESHWHCFGATDHGYFNFNAGSLLVQGVRPPCLQVFVRRCFWHHPWSVGRIRHCEVEWHLVSDLHLWASTLVEVGGGGGEGRWWGGAGSWVVVHQDKVLQCMCSMHTSLALLPASFSTGPPFHDHSIHARHKVHLCAPSLGAPA